jgi:hypothetical protein
MEIFSQLFRDPKQQKFIVKILFYDFIVCSRVRGRLNFFSLSDVAAGIGGKARLIFHAFHITLIFMRTPKAMTITTRLLTTRSWLGLLSPSNSVKHGFIH